MAQAITTKYLGPTTTRRSARIVAATASGLRKTTAWDYELTDEKNHAQAANHLALHLKWGGHWVGGETRKGFVWVSTKPACPFFIAVREG